MENDQKIAHRVNCAMIKNDDRSDTICTVNQGTDFHRKRCSQHCKSQAISTVTTLVGRELKGQGVVAVRSPNRMVTETNSEACAQLQLVLHAPVTRLASELSFLFSAPVGPFLLISIKRTAGGKPQICV